MSIFIFYIDEDYVIFVFYFFVIDGIVVFLGEYCEIVLYLFEFFEYFVIYVVNGYNIDCRIGLLLIDKALCLLYNM